MAWAVLGDSRHALRTRCPRLYMACCLCRDRSLLIEEEARRRLEVQNVAKLAEIDEVIERRSFPRLLPGLQHFRGFYARNQQFADQRKFEELFQFVRTRLSRLQDFRDSGIVQAPQRQGPRPAPSLN